VEGAIQGVSQLFTLAAIHLHRGVRQSPVGTVGDGDHHLEIAQQFGDGGRRRSELALPLRFEKQLRLFENALSNGSRGASPCSIQLPGFTAGEVVSGQRGGEALAVLGAGARHRHQELHRHVSGDRPAAHLLLHAFREQFDQRQPARYPTDAAIKAARQFLQTVSEVLLQFRQQPGFFQRRLAFAPAQRTVQHQSFGLTQRPDHRLHRVPAQLLERRQTLVAVNDQVTAGLAGEGYHHNRRLLARGRQRGQQSPLSLGSASPQMLPAPVQLMKLQLHRQLPCDCQS
jgi:hypothetical protein